MLWYQFEWDKGHLWPILSDAGLILVKEPYFNEAGYEKQRGSHEATDNSRKYNEMAIIKVLHFRV